MSSGSAALVLVLVVGGLVAYDMYVGPYLARHPVNLPTVSQVVTLITDAAGHARAQVVHSFNATLKTPNLGVTATVHTNATSLAELGFQAALQLSGAQFSYGQPNVLRGPDKTIFSWDVTILSFSAGLFRISADLIITLVSCGQCSTTTFVVPVELAMTVDM